MFSIIERLHRHIKDPAHATSMGASRKIYPPTTLAVVEAAEAKLEFRLPGLLRETYVQVGNGGFGPGYGLFGLEGGALAGSCFIDEYKHDLSELYLGLRNIRQADDPLRWQEKLVPICDWGCLHFSCVDCSQPAAPVIFYIGLGGRSFIPQSPSLEQWIESWLDGVDLWQQVMA
jgi:SMI1 / KNR4 family (SUKH-1)